MNVACEGCSLDSGHERVDSFAKSKPEAWEHLPTHDKVFYFCPDCSMVILQATEQLTDIIGDANPTFWELLALRRRLKQRGLRSKTNAEDETLRLRSVLYEISRNYIDGKTTANTEKARVALITAWRGVR